jgi:hypothetical protein
MKKIGPLPVGMTSRMAFWSHGGRLAGRREVSDETSTACSKDVQTFKATLEGISKYFRKNAEFQNYFSNILRNFEF